MEHLLFFTSNITSKLPIRRFLPFEGLLAPHEHRCLLRFDELPLLFNSQCQLLDLVLKHSSLYLHLQLNLVDLFVSFLDRFASSLFQDDQASFQLLDLLLVLFLHLLSFLDSLLDGLDGLLGLPCLPYRPLLCHPQPFPLLANFRQQPFFLSIQLRNLRGIAKVRLTHLVVHNINRLSEIVLKRGKLFLHRREVVSQLSDC